MQPIKLHKHSTKKRNTQSRCKHVTLHSISLYKHRYPNLSHTPIINIHKHTIPEQDSATFRYMACVHYRQGQHRAPPPLAVPRRGGGALTSLILASAPSRVTQRGSGTAWRTGKAVAGQASGQRVGRFERHAAAAASTLVCTGCRQAALAAAVHARTSAGLEAAGGGGRGGGWSRCRLRTRGRARPGSKASTTMDSVPRISARQNGQPWPSES